VSWDHLISLRDLLQAVKQVIIRASAFIFSASKISLTAACIEEKKGPESKNLFDFFDLAVKILPKLGSLSLLQNPVGFGQALGKTGQKPGFSTKFKEAVPKTEVLEQPRFSEHKSKYRCPGL
jgi:hypothetical protein